MKQMCCLLSSVEQAMILSKVISNLLKHGVSEETRLRNSRKYFLNSWKDGLKTRDIVFHTDPNFTIDPLMTPNICFRKVSFKKTSSKKRLWILLQRNKRRYLLLEIKITRMIILAIVEKKYHYCVANRSLQVWTKRESWYKKKSIWLTTMRQN